MDRFAAHVAVLAAEEGMRVNFRKTRVMRKGVQQRLAGVVVNQHLNVRRKDFDALKATLTQCVRHGLDSQNLKQHPDFRAQLAGRIAFVASLNAARGQKLRILFDAIPV